MKMKEEVEAEGKKKSLREELEQKERRGTLGKS